MLILGIDPGLSGGLAFCELLPDKTTKWHTYTMPTRLNHCAANETDVDALLVIANIVVAELGPVDYATIEHPPYIASNGIFGIAKLFTNFGEIRGVLGSIGVKPFEVLPNHWKAVILAGTNKDKDAAIAYIQNKFGDIIPKKTPRSKKYHDGIADAMCLAVYAGVKVNKLTI